jgi:hypothetical protein
MKEADELNLTLLERALEEHESARANLSRDLKIAVVLLLAFQFFVFFRFTKLSDQRFALIPQVKQATAHQQALIEIGAVVDKIGASLKTGTDNLSQHLENLPQEIRNELTRLNEDLKNFKATPFPPPIERQPQSTLQISQMNVAANVAQRVSGNVSRFFQDLNFTDSAALHAMEPDNPRYRETIIQIVETKIIKPAFETLNRQAKDLVRAPLETGLAELDARNDAIKTLKAAGAKADDWRESAAAAVAVASQLKFTPPTELDWWMSAQTKDAVAREAILDTRKIASQAGAALSGPETEIKSLAKTMDSAITDLKAQGDRIDEQLEQLKEHAASLEGLIDGYAKPLSLLALKPKELVIFYPVVLAIVVSTFAVRQVLLRRRAAILANAYRERGVSDEIIAVCFT